MSGTKSETMVVLDTHALLWWTLDPKELSDEARARCARMPETGGCASSISIWEIGIKVKRGHLDIGTAVPDYAARLQRIEWFAILPVTLEVWLENLALEWEHRDPADRTIVATAKLRGLPLISKDLEIAGFYPATLW